MGLVETFIASMSLNEEFTDDPNKPAKDYMIASFLALLVYTVLIAVIGKFLWNGYLSEYVTVIKPVKSPVDIIAISMLLGLVLGR